MTNQQIIKVEDAVDLGEIADGKDDGNEMLI
jgi:hypothetical protein